MDDIRSVKLPYNTFTMKSPPRHLSPSSFLTSAEATPVAERHFRPNGQIPLQQPISSASQLPNAQSNGSSFSHLASFKYIEQYRLFVERQRQLHNEERELWHTERQELHAKISELGATIQQLTGRKGSEIISPLSAPMFPSRAFASFAESYSHGSRTTSESVGDEFWRGAGGKSNSVPTRTFSESSEYSIGKQDERRVPGIVKEQRGSSIIESPDDISRQRSHETDEQRPRASIDGASLHKDLDGISFKPTALQPTIVKSVITPQSPSPLHPSSPPPRGSTQRSPNIPDSSPSNILDVVDAYTRDAGHTPLARITSDHTSNQATPTTTEQMREPRPSMAASGRPNERSDSYFPPQSITESEEPAEDPALKHPLTLPPEETEDNPFLNELDTKLLQAARTSTFSPESETSDAGDRKAEDKSTEHNADEDDTDPEPKLRIKRSMNFGSQLGAKNCGRRI
ncbi:hypothetical protein MMC30_001896 [Trapelia coarctata]|nr:hypothetical protein [Trapelia coarctata]